MAGINISHFDPTKARAAQERLSRKVVEESVAAPIKTVCGMDVSYRGDDGAGAAVVLSYPQLCLIEKKVVLKRALLPYITTFLAFREMPFFTQLVRALETKPDVFIISGHGIYHPAFLGSASHFGIAFDVPTIGIAVRPIYAEGEWRDGGTIYLNGREAGFAIGEPKAKLYVSVGHRITLEQAVAIVMSCLRGHRLPEPLFLAHSISRDTIRGI